MKDKINVEEILKRWGLGGENMMIHMKGAIKEIIEAVVDKCAEEAKAVIVNDGNPVHFKVETPKKASIQKESILQVKQQIEYE